MTPAEPGKRPPGNQVPVSRVPAFPVERRRTVAEVGFRSHVVDETIGAPHACWARLEQPESPPPPCDCERCRQADA